MSAEKVLIREVAKMLFDDIKSVHESDISEKEKAGIELMGLNGTLQCRWGNEKARTRI